MDDHPRFGGAGSRWGRMLFLSSVVGLLAGLAATLLEFLLHQAVGLLVGMVAGEAVRGTTLFPAFNWVVLILPVLGAAVSALLVGAFCSPKGTHGTEALVRAFHHDGGKLSLKDAAVKALAAVGVIGCGGSVGPEGPIAALGAGIGSTFAGLFRMTPRDRRIFLLAGCAGGVGAIFQCPLGGALFAATILYREPDIEADSLMPSIVSSVISFSTFMAFWGRHHPILAGTEKLVFAAPMELFAYAALAVLCALVAIFFYYTLRLVEGLPLRKRLPRWASPMVGGLIVGAMATAIPQVMDARYLFLHGALRTDFFSTTHPWTTWAMLLAVIVIAKCVATSVTVGSGNAGGLLGPTVFIGGAVGATTGALLEAAFPGTFPEPLRQALIPVGMAGVLSAAMRTPLAAIVMVTEMTGSYGLIVPLMFVSGVAYVIGRPWGLNAEQLGSLTESPAHAGESVLTMLEAGRVGDLADRRWPYVVRPSSTLAELVAMMPSGSRPTFAVVDGTRLAGVVSTGDILAAMELAGPSKAIIAADIMTASPTAAHPEESLLEAMERLKGRDWQHLPVVEEAEGEPAFVGMLDRREVLQAVRKRVSEQRVHAVREHAGMAALDQDQQLESLLSELPAERKGTVQRMAVPDDVAGRSLREADFRRRTGCEVIAIQTPTGEMLSPPDPTRPLGRDDLLIVVQGRR